MKNALLNIKSATLDFIRSRFRHVMTSGDANVLLEQLCGINDFFGRDKDFRHFLGLLEPRHIVSEDVERREFGDFQTPGRLSDLVCNILLNEGFTPDILKIAEHLGFKDARKLLTHLPDNIVQYMTLEKWEDFFAKHGKEHEEEYQGSLFETVPG